MQVGGEVGCISANKELIKPHPPIGRRVLESQVCENRKTLMPARDKYSGDIDVTEQLSRGVNEREIYRKNSVLFGEPVFFNGRIPENEELHDEAFYVEFGDDSQEHIEQELNNRTDEAATNRLSNTGVRKLKVSIEKYKQIFKLGLGTGEPEKFDQ